MTALFNLVPVAGAITCVLGVIGIGLMIKVLVNEKPKNSSEKRLIK